MCSGMGATDADIVWVAPVGVGMIGTMAAAAGAASKKAFVCSAREMGHVSGRLRLRRRTSTVTVRLDSVVGGHYPDDVSMLWGTDEGTLGMRQTELGSSLAKGLTIAGFNGDAVLDVATGGVLEDKVSVVRDLWGRNV